MSTEEFRGKDSYGRILTLPCYTQIEKSDPYDHPCSNCGDPATIRVECAFCLSGHRAPEYFLCPACLVKAAIQALVWVHTEFYGAVNLTDVSHMYAQEFYKEGPPWQSLHVDLPAKEVSSCQTD